MKQDSKFSAPPELEDAQLPEALKKSLIQTHHNILLLLEENTGLKQECVRSHNEHQKMQEELETTKQALDKLKAEHSELGNTDKKNREELAELKKELMTKKTERDAATAQLERARDSLQVERNSLKTANEEHQREVNRLQNLLSQAVAAKNSSEAQLGQVRQKVQDGIDQSRAQDDKHRIELDELRKEVVKAKNARADAMAQSASAHEKLEVVKSQLKEAQHELQQLRDQPAVRYDSVNDGDALFVERPVIFPPFEVLEPEGSNAHQDMYDGSTHCDNGQYLRDSLKAIPPSRYIPQILVDVAWHLTSVVKELSSDEEPHEDSLLYEEDQHHGIPYHDGEQDQSSPSHDREGERGGTDSFDISQTSPAPTDVVDSVENVPAPDKVSFKLPQKKLFVKKETPYLHAPISPAASQPEGSDRRPSLGGDPRLCENNTTQMYRDPRKRLRGEDMDPEEFERAVMRRRAVCIECYMVDKHCDPGAQCLNCQYHGYSCVRKLCQFGLACRFVRCIYLHPGQAPDGKEGLLVERGGLPRRQRLAAKGGERYRPSYN